MKKLLLSLILALPLLHAKAQQPAPAKTMDTLHMTLQQCIDYAINNQTIIKNSVLEAEKSHRQSQEYTGVALPQINGSFQFSDYLKLPTSLIPAEFFGGEPGTFIPIQFGTQYNGTAQINLQQLVFDGRYFLGLKATRALADLSEKKVVQNKIEQLKAS